MNMEKGEFINSTSRFVAIIIISLLMLSAFLVAIPKKAVASTTFYSLDEMFIKTSDAHKRQVLQASHSIYVNGEKAKVNPIVRNGQVYVPLEISVEGMGDKYELTSSENNATVTHDNSQYDFTLANAMVKVDGVKEHLHVKKSKRTTTPTGLETIKIGSDLFIPYESLNQLFDYEVSLKKRGNAYTIIVGTQNIKEDQLSTNLEVEENPYVPNKWKESPTGLYQALNKKYPLPEGIKPFKAKSTAFTTDYKKNINILANELGFEKISDESVSLNPYSTLNSMYVDYSTRHNEYSVQIEYWSASGKERLINNVTPYAFKEISRLFFGTAKGNEFYSLIEKGAEKNSDAYTKFNKTIKVGNREVYVNALPSSLVIYISEPNKKLKL